MSKIYLNDIICSISDVVDLYSPLTAKHSARVATIAYNLAKSMSLSNDRVNKIYIASLLHDIGSVSYHDRVDCLNFEKDETVINGYGKESEKRISKHAEVGYYLLRYLKHLGHIAEIVRYHHTKWHGNSTLIDDKGIPVEANIIHLADTIELFIKPDKDILTQKYSIRTNISKYKDRFHEELFKCFFEISKADAFWLEIDHRSAKSDYLQQSKNEMIIEDMNELKDFSSVLKRIIDFRSFFTSNHSTSVGNCARYLAGEMGFNSTEQEMITIAGYLHDLGKLAIPSEIINKPGPLTNDEYSIIRSHPYLTYKILTPIKQLDTIKIWAALHHEQMSGNGYPFRKTEETIPLGSKIVNYIDIFVALAEDRPYRKGMSKKDVENILKDKSENNIVSPYVHSVASGVIDYIEETRKESETENKKEFEKFISTISNSNTV